MGGLLYFNLRTSMDMGYGGRFNTGRMPHGWLFNGKELHGVRWGIHLKHFIYGHLFRVSLCQRRGWSSVFHAQMVLRGGQIVFVFRMRDGICLRLSIMMVRWYARRFVNVLERTYIPLHSIEKMLDCYLYLLIIVSLLNLVCRCYIGIKDLAV